MYVYTRIFTSIYAVCSTLCIVLTERVFGTSSFVYTQLCPRCGFGLCPVNTISSANNACRSFGHRRSLVVVVIVVVVGPSCSRRVTENLEEKSRQKSPTERPAWST